VSGDASGPFRSPVIMGPANKSRDDDDGEVGVNAVYMMASRKHGTLYIGVTSALLTRVTQHREGVFEGFTKRYGVKRLVWIEWHDRIESAIHREKRLKEYPRQWKVNLIERENPDWHDLFPGFFREQGPLAHLQEPVPSM
jgi:putative endonuclease